MGQHHDSAPSLNYTVISIDSPHMRKDGSNYLKFLLLEKAILYLLILRIFKVVLFNCPLKMLLNTLKVFKKLLWHENKIRTIHNWFSLSKMIKILLFAKKDKSSCTRHASCDGKIKLLKKHSLEQGQCSRQCVCIEAMNTRPAEISKFQGSHRI